MTGQSDRVREIVHSDYVARARAEGRRRFQVSAREVLHKAEENPDFPRARTPLICTVLQSKKLLDENELEIERIDGPPSRQSRKVVVHYIFRDGDIPVVREQITGKMSSPEEREANALRLGTKLYGLMKDEIAAYGVGEAYLKWVRGTGKDRA